MNTIINLAETFGLTEDQTLAGPSPLVRRQLTPKRKKALAEAATLWKRTFDGDLRASVQVREALSTSDLFVSATGDVLDRELMQQYAAITPEWQSFASRTTVRNFKPKKLVDLLGGRTGLDRVPELTAYPGAEHDTREFEIQVAKFGRQFGFSWEALINDDLDELQRIPSTFAQAATITEDHTALSLIADVETGAPNTDYFNSANGNAPATDALTAENVQAAVTTVRQRKDEDDNQVPAGQLILVVGPALEFEARAILEATEVRVTSGSRTRLGPNPLRGAVQLVVLSRLQGNSWFILPAPGQGRMAVAMAFLRGFETPDIRQKNQAGVGRGPDSGDFDDDSVRYRVRHVTGGAGVDPIHTYASTGGAGNP